MKLDEIKDIEVLRETLKSLMCKCIKELELINHEDKIIKTVIGEWYFYDYNEEYFNYGIYSDYGYHTSISEDVFKDYFELKEGD